MGLEHGVKWAAYRLTSTVLDDIWPSVLLLTGIAVMVQCVTVFTDTNLSINSITITVLGVIVSLVVSFKTNSSYTRWWDGRNIWSNINSNSRQLAMLFWFQIPNSAPKDKKEDKDKDKDKDKGKDDESDHHSLKSEGKRKSTSSEIEASPLLKEAGSPEQPKAGRSWRESQLGKKTLGMETEEDMIKQRDEIKGLIEKKTYIGLIQAFAVSLKHALRGENGPFYSDLYPLIAFLPKYNPSSHPPINRDHLMTLWRNGIPRQKDYHNDDTLAVPLTNPATFTGMAFHGHPETATSSSSSSAPSVSESDIERNVTGVTTTSVDFRKQALTSATQFARSDNPDILAFSHLDAKHRLNRKRSEKEFTPDGLEKVTITTVELMPPRHPPPIKIWDIFPPFRLYKMVTDYFKTQKMKEEQERAQGGKRKRPSGVRTEIPQEVLMYISAWITDLNNRNILNVSFASPIMTCIMELQKALSDLDKLATTPIPSAYSFHLRLTVLLYLFFLPFQLQQYLGWVTIPATAIASIVYLGFLEIGNQIEMPFAYDQSDLDLDKYVLKIAHQLAEVTAFPTTVPTSHVVLSHLNQPFLPAISLNAPTLLGLSEAKPHPTVMGFGYAFPQYDHEYDSDPDDDGSPPKPKPPKVGQLPKTMRDLELALGASWQEISSDTRKFTGGHKDQLENRTGLEVAVLAL